MPRTLIVLLVLIASFISLDARDPNNYGEGKSTDSLAIALWGQIDDLLNQGKPFEAFPLLDSLEVYATSTEDQHFIAWSSDTKAYLHLFKNEYALSKKYFLKALDIYHKYDKHGEICSVYIELAKVYKSESQFDSSYYMLQKAAPLVDIVPDTLLKQGYLMIKTGLFNAQGKSDSAYYYQQEMLEHCGIKDSVCLISVYHDMANTFINTYNYDRAEIYSDSALKYLPRSYHLAEIRILLRKVEILLFKGDFTLAAMQVKDVLSKIDDNDQSGRHAMAYTYLANIYLHQGDLAKAKEIITQVVLAPDNDNKDIRVDYNLVKLDIALRSNDYESSDAYYTECASIMEDVDHLIKRAKWLNLKSTYWATKGDIKKSLSALQDYTSLNDSLSNLLRVHVVENLDIQYETGKKVSEIQRLQLTEDLNKSRISKQRLFIWSLLGGLGLLGFLLFRIFKQNNKIRDQHYIISRALSEKEVLLKEIHHRVKNNLQVISSLLGIQSRSITDDIAREAIKESRSRVRTMSLIHQNLYSRDNLTGINMPDYLDKLTRSLVETYQTVEGKIDINCSADDIDLDVESVVPIGLIVNELITNSLKYAFPDGRDGSIQVFLKEDGDGLRLSVVDDGVGLNAEELRLKKDAFGHSLIKAFKKKLDADIHINGDDGTSVNILIRDFIKHEHLD